MTTPVGPSFIPKAALTTGRVLHQPFEVPTEMTKSALLQGGVTHSAIGGLNKTAAEAVQALEPRGPAKFLEKLFGKIDSSLVGSAAQAQKATEVFWVPFSNGAHQIGHAVSNPFSLFYAKRAGFEIPEDPAQLQGLLGSITDPDPESTKFPGFNWPTPAPPAEEGGETPPPADGETPPPADGETPPPADGETPPPADGETPPPADGETPPADGETPPPADGETPPAEGGGAPVEEQSAPVEDQPAPTEGEVVVTDGGGEVDAGAVPEGARSIMPVDEAAMAVQPSTIDGPIDTGDQPSPPPVDPTMPGGAVAGAAAGAATAQAPVVDEPAPTAPVAPPVGE